MKEQVLNKYKLEIDKSPYPIADDVASYDDLESSTVDPEAVDEETWSDRLREKIIAVITDERVQKASALSSRLLGVVSQVALAKNNPMALLSAGGSVVSMITESYGLNNLTEWDKFLMRNPMRATRSNIPPLLYRSGLLDKIPMTKFVENTDNNYLLGIRYPDNSIFAMLMMSDGRVTDHVWASPRFFKPGAIGEVYSSMISKAFSGAHVELGLSNDEGRNGLVLREYEHDLSVPYLGKHDPVKFADEVEFFRRRNIHHSVILHGPGGTGKTTFVMSYAELTKQRVFLVGPSAFENMNAGELEGLVDAIRPDILMLDDFDKARRNNIVYTTLPSLATKYPRMVNVITCNNPEQLDVAILRPGRGGDLVEFGVPDTEDKLVLLDQYMRHYKVDPAEFDLAELVSKMDPHYTHDWVRHIAKRAIDYSTQERLLGFIALTNKKMKLISRRFSDFDTKLAELAATIER